MEDYKPKFVEEIYKAVDWLDWEQDTNAIISHLDIVLKEKIGHITLRFTQQSFRNYPVFIFEDDRETNDNWNGYTKEEIAFFKDAVSKVVPILEDWNGEGFSSYSIMIDKKISKSLSLCCQNYHNAGTKIFNEWWWDKQIFVKKPEGWA